MEDFNSKYTGQQVEDLLDQVASGEAGGGGGITVETDPIFLASPAHGITTQDINAWNNKVDKVNGKQLSTEDFTSALKAKLEGLSNYDDTELSDALSTLRGDFDKLVSGDTTTAIKTFNEVIAFLDGIADSEDLNSIIASIEQQIANKANADSLAKVATSGSYTDLKNQPTIPSAVTESTVSGWGFTKNTGTYSKPSTGIPKTDMASAVQTSLDKADTALQSYTEQYKGTITGVSANGTSVATSGVANIPAATTSKYGVTKLSSATNSTSTTLAATPSAVKSAYDLANGKYTKPSAGIPFSDFEEQVQGSILKAEESVQSVSMGVTTGNATAGNFFSVTKDANGNVQIQMIQNTLASGKTAIPYTTDVKQYIDNAVANAGGGGTGGGAIETIEVYGGMGVPLVIDEMLAEKRYYLYIDNFNGSAETIEIHSFEGHDADALAIRHFYAVINAVDASNNGNPVTFNISLILPRVNIKWANNIVPTIVGEGFFELSITQINEYGFAYYNAVLTPFKS